jgi:O-antigen/teichoic acid export membrane protein
VPRALDDVVRRALDNALRTSVALMVPTVLLVMALREPVISLISSGRFTTVDGVLLIQVIGEIPRIAAYTAGAGLLPQGRVGAWLAAGASASVIRVATCLALLPSLGLDALAWSYLLEWVCVLALTAVVTRRHGPAASTSSLVLAAAGTAVAGGVAVVLTHLGAWSGGAVAVLCAAGWTAAVFGVRRSAHRVGPDDAQPVDESVAVRRPTIPV